MLLVQADGPLRRGSRGGGQWRVCVRPGTTVRCDVPRRMLLAPCNPLQHVVLLITWHSPPRLLFSTRGAPAGSGGRLCVLGDLRTCRLLPDPKRPCQTLWNVVPPPPPCAHFLSASGPGQHSFVPPVRLVGAGAPHAVPSGYRVASASQTRHLVVLRSEVWCGSHGSPCQLGCGPFWKLWGRAHVLVSGLWTLQRA